MISFWTGDKLHLRSFATLRVRRAICPSLSESGGRDQHSDFSFAADYSSSSVTCTSFISVISMMTIARVPLRSNTIPFARTYLPKKGISFSR
jgi:hypothetical protein